MVKWISGTCNCLCRVLNALVHTYWTILNSYLCLTPLFNVFFCRITALRCRHYRFYIIIKVWFWIWVILCLLRERWQLHLTTSNLINLFNHLLIPFLQLHLVIGSKFLLPIFFILTTVIIWTWFVLSFTILILVVWSINCPWGVIITNWRYA